MQSTIFFFIGHFIYLHVKYYAPSPFPVWKLDIPPLAPAFMMTPLPPIHLLPPHAPRILLCWDTEPSQYQGTPLLLMPHKAILLYIKLEPFVLPCVLFIWWFDPWELCGSWYCCSSYTVAKPFSFFSPSLNSFM